MWTRGSWRRVGRAFAIFNSVIGFEASGFFAWLIWSLVHIAYLIGFGNRIIVMFEWAWAYSRTSAARRLITGNPDEPVSANQGKWMQNLEAKFKLIDLDRAPVTGRGDRISFYGDATSARYFLSRPRGKLKLREEQSGAWLIFYARQTASILS